MIFPNSNIVFCWGAKPNQTLITALSEHKKLKIKEPIFHWQKCAMPTFILVVELNLCCSSCSYQQQHETESSFLLLRKTNCLENGRVEAERVVPLE